MEIPKELLTIISIFDNGMVWVYTGIFVVLMYLLISLLTWSFIKPLKYLGISTFATGILFIVIRLATLPIVNLIVKNSNIIEIILPGVLKPILLIGIFCIIIGIIMIVIYSIVNKKREKADITQSEMKNEQQT